ncbi:hypothetical protein [Pandoravirus japonicus]|uniref:Uncharacterized protein n=1 Tax=Pandoravirus japonicus TaxID=2823154 RepID=A0A811BPB8_9VIRU|nr:hypothetical protein [Pandoravirus japonicus]
MVALATNETVTTPVAIGAGALPSAAPSVAEPPRQATSVLRWVKIALGIVAVLVVVAIVVTVLYGTGCPKDKSGNIKPTNFLCGLAADGQQFTKAVRKIAGSIWTYIAIAIAGIAALFGLRGGGKEQPTGGNDDPAGSGDEPSGGGDDDPGGGGDDPSNPGDDPSGGVDAVGLSVPAGPRFRPPSMPSALAMRPVPVAVRT